MEEKKENDDKIGIRLDINQKEEKKIFDYFMKIKENLGLKTNTEVTRVCIKKAYEFWFQDKIEGKEHS